MADRNEWWATPYQAPVSEFTTPADIQRERISRALGWDVQYPAEELRRRLWMLGFAMRPGMGGIRPAPVPEGPWSRPAPSLNPMPPPATPLPRPSPTTALLGAMGAKTTGIALTDRYAYGKSWPDAVHHGMIWPLDQQWMWSIQPAE